MKGAKKETTEVEEYKSIIEFSLNQINCADPNAKLMLIVLQEVFGKNLPKVKEKHVY